MTRRLSVAARLLRIQVLVAGAALLLSGAAGFLFVREMVTADADADLVARALLAAETVRPLLADGAPDRERIAREGDRLGNESGARVTIVLPDGTVVADSAVGAAKVGEMENHAAHPEVAEALAGTRSFSTRGSITIRQRQRYVAVPIRSEGAIAGAARASLPVRELDRRLWKVGAVIWGTGGIAFLLILAGTALAARRVTGPLSELRSAALALAAGDLARRTRVRTGDELEETAETLNDMASRLGRTIAELDEGRTRLATILSGLADGVIVVAPDRTVRMINPEAVSILDIGGGAVEGRPSTEAVRHPGILAVLDRWLAGEAPGPREVAVASRRGNRTIRVAGTTVRYRGGTGADVLLTLRDVTEERRLARVKSEFVSNASHELRTPLTNVRGYVEAAQDALKEGAPPDPSFLEIAHANALRMERIIDDLLELSRAESGAVPLEKEESSPGALLGRVADLHRGEAERKGKTIDIDAGGGTFRADLRKLALALSNLVDNALKYGKERGRVTLSGRVEGDACVLEVSDDGPGIPPEHLPRIFERFYRVDRGRSRDLGGTGLGLSIAKHIVESHGGTIRVESRLGEGTRVVLRVPA